MTKYECDYCILLGYEDDEPCVFEVEEKNGKQRITRTTTNPRTGKPNKPKKTTYSMFTVIVDGSDKRTYLLEFGYGFISVRSSDFMDAGTVHETSSSDEYAEARFAGLRDLLGQVEAV